MHVKAARRCSKGQVRRLSRSSQSFYSPDCRGDMEDDVDVFDQKRAVVRVNSQAGQHAVTGNGDDFVTKLRVISFDDIEQLMI